MDKEIRNNREDKMISWTLSLERENPMLGQCWVSVVDGGSAMNQHWFKLLCFLSGISLDEVGCNLVDMLVVQAVRGFSVHYWEKLQFFTQMIINMYSFDPDKAQSILTRLTPN